MHIHTTRSSAVLLSLLAGLSLLSACSRDDDRTAGQRVDQAVATTERKATEVAADTRQAVANAGDTAAAKSKDMAITAEVKTRLARDDKLSALAINVDTDGGRVMMRGSAPDEASRTRATELARGVEGVVGVANELSVKRSN